MRKVLLVGQGIAGSVLGIMLQNEGIEVLWVDGGITNSASIVSAGVCNPITGRNWTKTWMADTIFPEARKFYQQCEHAFGTRIVKDIPIAWLLSGAAEENDWMLRSATVGYEGYLSEVKQVPSHWPLDISKYRMGLVSGGFTVNWGDFLPLLRKTAIEKGSLIETCVPTESPEKLELLRKQHGCDAIVLCDGAATQYPSLQTLVRPNRGIALLVDIENLQPEYIIKRGVSVIPLGKHYWVGSTYLSDNQRIDVELEKNKLLDKLNTWCGSKTTLLEVKTGLRPTVKDRRPLLGCLDSEKKIYCFNGLGTKGSSLAPFFATQMLRFLLNDVQPAKEVLFSRF